MHKVFISYRRADSAAVCGRIYDRLVQQYGRQSVFKDVDTLSPGADFSQEIQRSLRECSAVLVVIGPRWSDARDAFGNLRLYDPADLVRLEVEEALHLRPNLTVIPVLVEEAPMPTSSNLPPTLQPLVDLNASPVRNDPDFDRDIGRLLDALNTSAQVAPVSDFSRLVETDPLYRQCAWIYPWLPGKHIADVHLVYDDDPQVNRYADAPTSMPRPVRESLGNWHNDQRTEYDNLMRGEPAGTRVRLESVEWSAHTGSECLISLSPTKYLYYLAIQARLGQCNLASVRQRYYANAIGNQNGKIWELPSIFAIHMGIVSSDGFLFLRKRLPNTALYPSAWEAGIGELMHGPKPLPEPSWKRGADPTRFRNFTADGKPDLLLYLQGAVAEELDVQDAREENFTLYGFAIEYETLAPKLLVIYTSRYDIKTLRARAEGATDRAVTLDQQTLSLRGIESACARYPSWGPTSKLIMLLALSQHVQRNSDDDQIREIDHLTDQFQSAPHDDPWQCHGQAKSSHSLFFRLIERVQRR